MSIRSTFAILSMGVLLAAAAPLQAHHSFSATYDSNKPITLRGTISKLGWTNPHAHVFVDVKNPAGKMITWEVETGAASALLRQGLRKEDLIGAEVVVKGYMAKDGTPTLNASSMLLTESKKEYTNDITPNADSSAPAKADTSKTAPY
jgi:hypothetical protein